MENSALPSSTPQSILLCSYSLSEYVVADVRVDGAEGVVQQVHVRVAVERPRQADPGLLTAAQADSALSDQCLITLLHQIDVLMNNHN